MAETAPWPDLPAPLDEPAEPVLEFGPGLGAAKRPTFRLGPGLAPGQPAAGLGLGPGAKRPAHLQGEPCFRLKFI